MQTVVHLCPVPASIYLKISIDLSIIKVYNIFVMSAHEQFESKTSHGTFLEADKAVELTAGVFHGIGLDNHERHLLTSAWRNAFLGIEFFESGLALSTSPNDFYKSVRISDETGHLGELWLAQRQFTNAPRELGGQENIDSKDMYRIRNGAEITNGTLRKRRMNLRLAVLGSASGGAMAEAMVWHSPVSTAAALGTIALASIWSGRDAIAWPQKHAKEIQDTLAAARREFDATGIEIVDGVVDFHDMPPTDKISLLDKDFLITNGIRVRNGKYEIYADAWMGKWQEKKPVDPYLKPVQLDDRLNVARLYANLLRHDAEPRELWATYLHDSASRLAEYQTALKEIRKDIKLAKMRNDYTGVDDNEGIQLLEKHEKILNEQARELVIDTLMLASERHVQQRNQHKLEIMLGKHRELLEAAIVSPDTEVQHPQADVLRVFRDVLYDAALQTEGDDTTNIAALDALCKYVEGMAPLLTSSDQSRHFYLGLLKKNPANSSIELPEWDEIAPKFISATINS